MGVFDTYADSPFQIKNEGQTITLAFRQGVPAAGQGTVTWNIPVPGVNCNVAADGRTGAYAGIVILLSTSPLIDVNIPVDGQIYTADPTANYDLHAGDRINGALVVGAFYECEKKGSDDLTDQLVISDLQPNTPYYVGAYAVDCQYRYHTEGVRAYSDQHGASGTPDTPAVQFISLSQPGSLVLPTDGTGLIPGMIYQFDLMYGTKYPTCNYDKIYRININGSDAGTYKDLIDALNKQFALLDSPVMSPVPPNAGKFVWDPVNKKLYEFNGTSLVLVDGVLVESSNPASVSNGTYWHIPSTHELYIRSGTSWNLVPTIDFGNVDAQSLECTDYWFDGSQGFVWNGSTWCTVTTLVSTTDPSCPPANMCGAFWFDTANAIMYKWDVVTAAWIATTAIFWPEAPNNLSLGTLWIDNSESTPKLYELATTWNQLPVVVSVTQPALHVVPVNGYWYNPDTEALYQCTSHNVGSDTFVEVEVLVWPDDPMDVTSCELWWDAVSDDLFVWDVVNSEWDQVVSFTESSIDPSLPPSIEVGTVWFNPSTSKFVRWDGSDWIAVDFVNHPTDPTQPSTGDAWFKLSTSTWYIWNAPTPGSWNEIDPIDSENDPTAIPSGVYWFNTVSNLLFVRQGASWISVPYTTGSLLPSKGDKYFNTNTNMLYVWNGFAWVVATLKVYVALNPIEFCGSSVEATQSHIVLATGQRGSGMNLKVLVPGAQGSIGSGHADSGMEGIVGPSAYEYPNEAFRTQINSSVPEQAFLWNNLMQGVTIPSQVYGSDGVSDKPSYLELGVGTDGNAKERRALADTVRRMLGYPAVEVELTKDQLDDCITFALEVLRTRSSLGYKRGFFFLDIVPRQQKYVLSNRQIGYHKIVNVASVMRFTSAFLSSSHGSGVYGQVVLQHLYNMGTYDLTSFHLVAQYVEQLEIMFATRLTFQWDEPTRRLDLYNSFTHRERVLLDTTIERTEQEILRDRWAKNWIRQWTLAEAKEMLGNTRSKFGSLPGAGGGVSLNGSELLSSASDMKRDLIAEIDDYVVNDAEDLGMGTQFIIG